MSIVRLQQALCLACAGTALAMLAHTEAGVQMQLLGPCLMQLALALALAHALVLLGDVLSRTQSSRSAHS